MIIDSKTYRLPAWVVNAAGRGAGCWFRDATVKDLIILHFTAGSTLNGAVQHWKVKKDGVSTPYIVDRDGRICEVYPPERWSYHLGMTKGNPNHIHERRAIGIEIVNAGPLKLVGENLRWWDYEKLYCSVKETKFYKEKPFRGASYYATFPEAQMIAVGELVRHLCERFAIPHELPPLEKRMVCDVPFYGAWKGIAAHHNFRADKFDVGPAFNWSAIK